MERSVAGFALLVFFLLLPIQLTQTGIITDQNGKESGNLHNEETLTTNAAPKRYGTWADWKPAVMSAGCVLIVMVALVLSGCLFYCCCCIWCWVRDKNPSCTPTTTAVASKVRPRDCPSSSDSKSSAST